MNGWIGLRQHRKLVDVAVDRLTMQKALREVDMITFVVVPFVRIREQGGGVRSIPPHQQPQQDEQQAKEKPLGQCALHLEEAPHHGRLASGHGTRPARKFWAWFLNSCASAVWPAEAATGTPASAVLAASINLP